MGLHSRRKILNSRLSTISEKWLDERNQGKSLEELVENGKAGRCKGTCGNIVSVRNMNERGLCPDCRRFRK